MAQESKEPASDQGPGDGVRLCTDSDLPELQRFQSRVFGKDARQLHSNRTDWLFADNPFRPSEVTRTLWIYRNGGEIVAAQGVIPFELKVGDEHYLAYWGVELISEFGSRDSGMAYELAGTAAELCLRVGFRVVCALGLSEDAYKFAARQGITPLTSMPLYLWAGDVRKFANGLEWAGSTARMVGSLLRGPAWLTARICRFRSRTVDLLPIERFDGRVDAVWERVSPIYPIISRRDFVSVSWRFDRCPYADQYRRYYLMENDSVIGYVVLRSTRWHDQQALAIVDYLSAPRRVSALFASVALLARRERVATLLCWSLNHRAHLRLTSLGFIRRRHGHPFIAVVPLEGDPVSQTISDPDSWFLTAADSDVD